MGLTLQEGYPPEVPAVVLDRRCALGHPVGATGGRLLATIVAEMERRDVERGAGPLVQRV